MKTNRMYVVLAASFLLGNCKPNELMNDSIKPLQNGERLAAQSAPVKQWDVTQGGVLKVLQYYNNQGQVIAQYPYDTDQLRDVLPLADGGMILAGSSNTFKGRDKTSDPIGPLYSQASSTLANADYWLVNVDQNGTKRSTQLIGGSREDMLSTIIATPDGGYLVGGYSNSPKTPADSLGLTIPYKTRDSRGNDFWIVKLNARGGKEWDTTIGGINDERLSSIVATRDGGYLLGGTTNSPADTHYIFNLVENGTHGGDDYWVVKIDAHGFKQWDRSYGTAENEILESMIPTQDSNFLLVGRSGSQCVLTKIDGQGNKIWDKTLKTSTNLTNPVAVVASADGGFALATSSDAPAGYDKSQNSGGGLDYWIVKLDRWGGKVWDKTIQTSKQDYFASLALLPDGGYLVGGATGAKIDGDKTETGRGFGDYWLVKVNDRGAIEWDKSVGSPNTDILDKVVILADGGILAAGSSASHSGGDKTLDSSPSCQNYWAIKLK